jgi:hypothetical protein
LNVRSLRALAHAALLSIAACRSGSTTSLKTTGEFTARAWPEADQLFHREPRWLGADAAFSVPLGGERVLWLFGDTFIATSNALERRASRMVRNTIAVQRGLDPSTADIEFQWGSGPSSWIADEPQRWFWPQHGVRLPAGPLVLFFSSVRSTPDEGFGFEADGWIAVAASFLAPSKEPRTKRKQNKQNSKLHSRSS